MLAVVGTANAVIDVPLFSLPVRLASDAVLARAFGVFEAMISLGVGARLDPRPRPSSAWSGCGRR